MPQSNFNAQVSAWVAKTKTRMKAVRDESVQRLVAVMQTPVAAGGNMPVNTGFLRASGFASLNGELQPLVENPGQGTFDWEGGQLNAVLTQARLEDKITFAYTANYAVYQEYGTSHMEGRRFVGLAVQQWPQIVDQVCREAEARFG